MPTLSPALCNLCISRLGFDPSNLPDDQLQRQLPSIIRALQGQTRELIEAEKSNARLALSVYTHCPNPGLVRDERVPPVGEHPPGPDRNSVLDSVFPFGA